MSTTMGSNGLRKAPSRSPTRDIVALRSGFFKELAMRDDVVATEYDGLGFNEVHVALGHTDGLPEHVLSTARRVGYEVTELTRSVFRLEVE